MCIQKGAFWHQMLDAGIIEHQKFSLCFSKETKSDSDGTSAGAVTMGGVDTNLHTSPMVYAEGHVGGAIMHGLTIRKVYFMKPDNEVQDATPENTIALDITTTQLNRGRVILDSGTTDTYFTREIATTFKAIFKFMTKVDYNTHGMKLTDEQVNLLPSLVVQLNGYEGSAEPSQPDESPGLAGKLDPDHPNDVLVVIPPNSYIEHSSADDRYYPRIYPTEASGSVLGANFMAGHDILFDIPENQRIGFATSNCDYGALNSDAHSDEEQATDTR